MTDTHKYESCDVAIIGGGPAGLAAATALKKEGIKRVTVLERDAEAGGIPRHCGHPPFGICEYKRVMAGPSYARRIVETARNADVNIALKATVTALGPEGVISIISPEGSSALKAKRVLLATGTRETPRSARLISGNRALGICNTGTLQSMVYLKNLVPFHRPVVVGTEIVGLSALLTCRKAGIRPVAMIEEKSRATVKWPLNYTPKLFGVPLLLSTQIVNINGNDRVDSVRISTNGKEREIDCDGVLFTGQFIPESSLARMSHLALDQTTGLPIIDKYGRCSDLTYYAAGNVVLNPVQIAGKCWRGGRTVAKWIAKDLAGTLP